MGSRTSPNILITGTPGTGKTSTCELITSRVRELGGEVKYINVGDLVKEKDLHDGYDEEYQTYMLDEDKICDEMEDTMASGGVIVDLHSCDFFPERWFDKVFVLRADNSILYSRLEKREYPTKKLQENVEAEIMQVVLEEAREAYAEGVVVELPSNSLDDLHRNVEQISQWIVSFVPQ